MKPLEKTANDLFQILRTRFSPVTIGDENAQVTTDPAAARFFSFAYKERNRTHGTVSVSIVSNRSLKVYFSHDMIENIVNTVDWHSFLKELRYFAKRNLLGFDARDIQKSQLDTRDFAFIKQNDGPYREEDVEITESAMYGSKRKSMQQFENATLVVYHKRTVDEEKRGARSRHIDSIFIESNHERFRFPINYLNGARAMAVHVSEGGTPYDAIGQHIVTTVSEMQNLAKFARITKRHAMENAEAGEIRDRVVEKYHGIKRDIMRMQNVNNYRQFAETFEPAEAQLDETEVESLKEKFTRQIWNEKMNDLLPSVQRALATESSSETNDIRRLAGMAATEVAEDDIEEFGKSLNDFVKIPLSQKMKLMQRLEQMGAEWMQLRATTPDGETVAYMDPVDDDGDRAYYDYYAKPELMGESVQEAKPDFLDLDKDGDRKESMKKAAADKEDKEDKKDKVDESKERPYVCVHAKKGKHNCTASSSYEAAKKAAEHWNLKSTAGIDAHLADKEKIAEAIMVSAEGSEAESLLQILKLSGMGANAPAPEPTGGYDSGPLPALPEPADDMGMEMQDEYSNTPNEFEQDIDAVIDGGDDLHREKDQYAATEPGDNPMRAFEGKFKAILDDLLAEDQHPHSEDESKHA